MMRQAAGPSLAPGNKFVILYDGACGLCNRTVQFVLAWEKHPWCRFAALQSPAGRRLVRDAGRDPDRLDSVYLWTGNALLDRSDAILEIARHLRWPWRWVSAFRWVPRSIRDAMYNTVARRRYRWFGKRDLCFVPSGVDAARFLVE